MFIQSKNSLSLLVISALLVACGKVDTSEIERQRESVERQRIQASIDKANREASVRTKPALSIINDGEVVIYLFVDPETKCEYLVRGNTITPRMEARRNFTDRWQVCNN